MNIILQYLVLVFVCFGLIMLAKHVDGWMAMFGILLYLGIANDLNTHIDRVCEYYDI